MARKKFAVPDGIVLDPAADKTKKLTAFTSQLLLAIKKDPGLDRVQWAEKYLEGQSRPVSQIRAELLERAETLKSTEGRDFPGEPNIQNLKRFIASDNASENIKATIQALIDELEAAQK